MQLHVPVNWTYYLRMHARFYSSENGTPDFRPHDHAQNLVWGVFPDGRLYFLQHNEVFVRPPPGQEERSWAGNVRVYGHNQFRRPLKDVLAWGDHLIAFYQDELTLRAYGPDGSQRFHYDLGKIWGQESPELLEHLLLDRLYFSPFPEHSSLGEENLKQQEEIPRDKVEPSPEEGFQPFLKDGSRPSPEEGSKPPQVTTLLIRIKCRFANSPYQLAPEKVRFLAFDNFPGPEDRPRFLELSAEIETQLEKTRSFQRAPSILPSVIPMEARNSPSRTRWSPDGRTLYYHDPLLNNIMIKKF